VTFKAQSFVSSTGDDSSNRGIYVLGDLRTKSPRSWFVPQKLKQKVLHKFYRLSWPFRIEKFIRRQKVHGAWATPGGVFSHFLARLDCLKRVLPA